MDLSTLANPYDFAHPVTDPELFIGRTNERGEIGYYLDQAAKTQRPVSLAIIGDRAAGKTSLLNIIEAECETKKLFAVRIDLDESDIQNELRFFHKILNAVIIKAFDNDHFGGKASKTYSTYLDMISAYVVPDTLVFAPWTFPTQYARALANDRPTVALDDASYKEDLKKIHAELARTVVLIFDECNVFRAGQRLLQKIRNIFMNLPGYMLVFSGTKDLFPIMDDIFSPIIRQFKKIEIGAFTRIAETSNGVRVPLTKAGIPDRKISKLLSAPEIVSDIHRLSAGRPYEIQLICHMLMRRCQMGQAKKFLLNINVLEEIRSELAVGQNLAERGVISAVKGLPKRSLEALGVLCACEERVEFEDIWKTEWTIRGDARWSKAQLKEQESLLASLRIIDDAQGYLKFAGDEFDRIYVKYVARQKQVTFTTWRIPSEALFWLHLERALSSRWEQLQLLGKINLVVSAEDAVAAVSENEEKALDDSFFSSPVAEDLTAIMFAPDGASHYIVLYGSLEANHQKSHCSLIWPIAKDDKLERLFVLLSEMVKRAADIGWKLHFEHTRLKKPDPVRLAHRIKREANAVFNARIAATIGSYLPRAYVEARNRELSYKYVECILALEERPRPNDLNNIGYVALSRDDFELAERFFRQALQSNEKFDSKLTLYNLGICSAVTGKIAEAMDCFKRAQAEVHDGMLGCVFGLERNGDKLEAREIFDVDELDGHIKTAMEICAKMSGH